MLASFHNHTARCGHAEGTPEEYVLHAIDHGYTVFGFSDHAPILTGGPADRSRMRPEELRDYVSDILFLKEKYRSRIDIKIGLELEYFPYYHKKHMKFFREAGVEYLILGQHYTLTGNNGEICSFEDTVSKERYTLYVDHCIEGLATGDFCCFAHPDVFKFSGDGDFYRSESERLIRAAMKYSVPLEVNMYGLLDNRHYPRPAFWDTVGELGAEVVLGRDAHSVERVHCESEFPMAYEFIKKHGLNLIERRLF